RSRASARSTSLPRGDRPMIKTAVLLLAIGLAPVVSPSAAPAHNPGGLSFSATLESIKINARPNQVVTRQFSLTLDDHQPATHFNAHDEDWCGREDGKQSFYAAPGTLKQSCSNWVALNPVESVVKAGETM